MKVVDASALVCMNAGASGSTWAGRDAARFRQSLIGRSRVEPFALWLQGREALYEEKFYCVIRVARVVTDEWGMQALAIPLFGFRLFRDDPDPPVEPWTFELGWADASQSGLELSAGMFSPRLYANAKLISRLRAACLNGTATLEEIRAAHFAKGNSAPGGEVACPWTEPGGPRKWWVGGNGQITVYSWKNDWFDEFRTFDPLEHLQKVPQFFANFGPNQELTEFVFGALLRQPDGAGVFRGLLGKESRAAQLYGLRGLLELDAADYAGAYHRYRQSTARVLLQEKGEPLRSATVAEIARRIHAGEFRITNEYYFR